MMKMRRMRMKEGKKEGRKEGRNDADDHPFC